MTDKYTNLLLWGVETDEEVQNLIKKFDKEPIYNLNSESPFKAPKSEWTEEMKKQYAEFKAKHL